MLRSAGDILSMPPCDPRSSREGAAGRRALRKRGWKRRPLGAHGRRRGRLLGAEAQRLAEEDDVRVTTAFNADASPARSVRRRRRVRRRGGDRDRPSAAPPAGLLASAARPAGSLQIHDRRVKRWRHLDLGANRCVIECELRRLRCRDCGVRLEPVPWARPGARAHARLRGRRRVAGPADGQDADHRPAADRLGHRRADRRARRRRPPRRAPARRAWSASASTRSATAAASAT